MTILNKKVNVWLIFLMAGIITVFFLWYFLKYVPSNEKILIQKNFRVLNQIGENFKQREKDYRRVIGSGRVNTIIKENKKNGKIDKLNNELKKIVPIEAEEINKGKDLFSIKNYKEGALSLRKSNDGKKENKIIKVNFSLKDDVGNSSNPRQKFDQEFYYFRENNQLFKHKSKSLCFKIKKNEFFDPLVRKDVFEELIIIKEKCDSSSVPYQFIYSSVGRDFNTKNFDSLFVNMENVYSGIYSTIILSGIEYVLFIKKVRLFNGEQYYIGGIIEEDFYTKQKRAIDPYTVVLIFIIFFLFLLSIPIIKLKIIEKKQQLKLADYFLSVISILIGIPFTFIAVLSYFTYTEQKDQITGNLIELSDSIKSKLTDEIELILGTLNTFRDKIEPLLKKKDLKGENDSAKNNRIALDCKPDSLNLYLNSDELLEPSQDPILLNISYKYFKSIFILDDKGIEVVQTSSRKNEQGGDAFDTLAHRNYYKKSGEWRLGAKELMLDFIVSNTTGEKLGVVSIKKGEYIYVLSSRLYSVINTILPDGYQFCIIDKAGDVKFHSDDSRMLQENFIDELKNPNNIKQAIYGNIKDSLSINYLGKEQLCYIQPVKNLPLYLVTLYDKDNLKSVNLAVVLNTLSFTMILILLFLIMVLGSRLVINSKSELKRKLDILGWIKPNKKRNKRFLSIYITNGLIIITLIISSFLLNPEALIVLVFSTVISQLLITFCYMNYSKFELFIIKYWKSVLFPSTLLFILVYHFAQHNIWSDDLNTVVWINLCTVILTIIILIFISKSKRVCKKYFHAKCYFYSWTCLLIISPIFLFYILFYNHEVKTEVARQLYEYAKDESARNYEIDKLYDDKIIPSLKEYKTELKENGIYELSKIKKLGLKSYCNCNVKQIIKCKLFGKNNQSTIDEDNSKLAEIALNVKPDIDINSRERKSLLVQSNFNNSSNCDTLKNPDYLMYDSLIVIKYKPKEIRNSKSSSQESKLQLISYSGTFKTFQFSKDMRWGYFIFINIMVLIILGKLIKFILDKVPCSLVLNEWDEHSFEDILKEHLVSKNNLIIQFANTHEKEFCYDKLKYILSNQEGWCFVKYSKINEHEYDYEKTKDRLVIDDFELNLTEYSSIAHKKLLKIKKLKKEYDQILIISYCSIEKYIDEIDDLIDENNTSEREKGLKILKSELELLKYNYIPLYYPINIKTKSKLNNSIRKSLFIKLKELYKNNDNALYEIMQENSLLKKMGMFFFYFYKDEKVSELEKISKLELNASEYLTTKHESYINNYGGDLKNRYFDKHIVNPLDKLVLKVEELAAGYYNAIWEACSDSERILLYDIADDLLINDKNKEVIKILLKKGLLISGNCEQENSCIQIMNKSFRNFVIKKYECEYKEKYAIKYESTGKWANYKTPIIMLVLALAFFIALQENFLTNLTTILPALVAALGLLTKVSGVFSKSADTTSNVNTNN